MRGETVMPKRAVSLVKDSDLAHDAEVSPEEMEARRAVAASIRASMAKPASELEIRLWREFVAELEKERLTIRA